MRANFSRAAVKNLLIEAYLLASLCAVLLALLLIEMHSFKTRRILPIPVIIMLITLITVLVTMQQQGASAAFWFFPLLLGGYYAMPTRLANNFAALVVAGSAGLLWWLGDSWSVIRYVPAMTICALLIRTAMLQSNRLTTHLSDTAERDPLTGAYNRRRLSRLRNDYGYGTGQHALLILGIDHFKTVNDRFGHAVGDRVLRDVVRIMQDCIRTEDTLLRLGGEEFAILMRRGGAGNSYALAERIRDAVADARLLGEHQITVSSGVSMLRSPQEFDSALRRADHMLFMAKKPGRNRTCHAQAASAH